MIHRLEVLGETGEAVVYEYRVDDEGRKFYDPEIDDAAQHPPRTVRVSSPPPLRRR